MDTHAAVDEFAWIEQRDELLTRIQDAFLERFFADCLDEFGPTRRLLAGRIAILGLHALERVIGDVLAAVTATIPEPGP